MDHVPDTLYNSLLAARDLLELFPYDLDLSALHYPSNYLTHYRKPLSLNEFLYRAVDSIEDVFFKIDDGGIKSIKAVSINGKFSQTSPLSKVSVRCHFLTIPCCLFASQVLDPFLAYLCDLGRESFESFAPGVGRDTPSFSRQNPVSCQRLVNWLGWLIHGGHRFYQSDGVWKTYPSVLAWYRDQGGTLQGEHLMMPRRLWPRFDVDAVRPSLRKPSGGTAMGTRARSTKRSPRVDVCVDCSPPPARSSEPSSSRSASALVALAALAIERCARGRSVHIDHLAEYCHFPTALSLAHAGAAQPSLVLLSQRQQSVYRMMKTA